MSAAPGDRGGGQVRPGGRSLPDVLAEWMVRQRWYAGKGSARPRLDRLGGLLLREAPIGGRAGADDAPSGLGPVEPESVPDDAQAGYGPGGPSGDAAAGVGVEVFFVAATGPGPAGGEGRDGIGQDGEVITYQVPLTYRSEPEPSLAHALVGVIDDPARGRQWIYDAPHDPEFVEAWLELLHDGTEVTAPEGGRYGRAYGVPYADVRTLPDGPARVLVGEQSNTSVIVGAPVASSPGFGRDLPEPAAEDGEPRPPVIIKLFRVLHAGPNPDVSVQTVLAAAGCERVPHPVGAWEASWTGPAGDTLTGHLGYASEFVAGAQDAWRSACLALEDGYPFTAEAYALGEATAQVHAALAAALPTIPVDRDRLATMSAALLARVDWAVAASGGLLEPYRAAARRVAAGVAGLTSAPPLQHVHGDLHLGQVLNSPERGWLLLDFEGEPLRPLAERTAPDLALRDVAGLLRSFDYAARHTTVELAEDDDRVATARHWAREASDAFLDGYAKTAGRDPREDATLLRALELDKALYEVVYEVRNRPEWTPVPLGAVRRLLGEEDLAAPGPAQVPGPAEAPAVRGGDDGMNDDEEQTVSNSTGTGIPHDASTVRLDEPDVLSGAHGPATPQPVDPDVLAKVAGGAYYNPHAVLGAHPYEGTVTVRTLRPLAASVEVVLQDGTRVPMRHEWDGVWVAVIEQPEVGDYRIAVTYEGFPETVTDDPYRFLPTLGEVDLHLLREGRHEELWRVLGAHVRRYPGVMGEVVGTSFAVWAPNAQAVRVVSDANQWIGRLHAMRSLGDSGVWELFVPGAVAGTKYKFEILAKDGQWRAKADPLAQAAEVPPATASVVVESTYEWGDQEWIERRAATSPHAAPMSVYEVHLGSWRQGLTYTELADQLVGYVKDMGFTHVEFMPVMQHPFGGSWGYHVTGYYAADSRFGSPDELRFLIDKLHQAGIGVLLDWVPGHFATDDWALMRFDGEPLYEHPDPRKGWHPEWGSFIFNFGRTEVRNFLVANALFWLEEFHADGLRVDGVASMLYLDYSRKDGEWEPNAFGGRENLEAVALLQETNATAYRRNPGVVVIAEESTAWPGVTRPTHLGGLGFGFKWNMGWMHDSLTYMSKDPIHRQYHHHQMTFSMMYAYTENFILPISHDEVVHGKGSLLRKMPGDRWQQLANVRAYLAFMWAHPGKQLLFMGCELGQEAEWAENRSLDWWLEETPWHAGLQQLVRDLNARYKEHPALWELDNDPRGFEWIDANDADDNTFSFIRHTKPDEDGVSTDLLVCVVNFSPVPREGYRIGLPRAGRYREVLNTDATVYAGSGVGNGGFVDTEDVGWHGRPVSAELRVPPLGAVWLVPEPAGDA